MAQRPQSEPELQKREAIGVIRASRFVRRYAHSHRPISIQTIREIHQEIFIKAWPEIAGEYRQENVKISGSEHLPPHFSTIPELMQSKNQELTKKLVDLKLAEGHMLEWDSLSEKLLDRIVFLAAWVHHSITYIHPFREGNGRTARLAANLILERYGLVGISIKIEKENKKRYHQSLVQIDKMGDYKPLQELIYDGLLDRYNGVTMKYYEADDKKNTK